MARRSQREALVLGLRARGFRDAERQSTRRYLVMLAPEGALMKHNFYVGKAAALRYGRTAAVSQSLSSSSWHRKVIEEGMKL